ncbi:hypothetical protein E8E13_000470 [Curvularia kusanoi]|uniref:Uncharacterized protein n=1 Tax=Curvularia kusanoi TaxID=90978 RepID=A0A9P4W5K5_CURKU|nr:hypothetical protein E8E13_000470 [Curvularia kusanoi]
MSLCGILLLIPVFALGLAVSKDDLQQAAKTFNNQAKEELCFSDEELAEMGYVAAVPDPWQLHDLTAHDAAQWHLYKFDKRGHGTIEEPQWYLLGFLGIFCSSWKETGVVLVFYDARSMHPEDEPVPVVAFVVDLEQVGSSLNSLRQGDDDIERFKGGFEMA